jgi:tRNA ligase
MSSNSTPKKDFQQDLSETHKLIAALQLGLKDNTTNYNKKDVGFSCRKTTFEIENTSHSVESWKFQEYQFKKSSLPVYARGLFTWKDEEGGGYRIVVRGYDKFFNVDEVRKTKWDWIEKNTVAPYEVTVKENGCIIFISGLPDGTLLVCSKHSIGFRNDSEVAHAVVGERWVDKQLANLGRTRIDFAKVLYEANITAVAELCDDSFEEHILAYKEDAAGLYLHGVNYNLKDFSTFPMTEVQKFADEWGFRKIDYFLKDSTQDLRKFLENAAETGSWDGKDVEGFVIRCKAKDHPSGPEWHDWFFKFKFEEPYLMYRQWRECTKALIKGRAVRIRKQVKITNEYIKFASEYFKKNPGASKLYENNHGIIKLRNEFLAFRGMKGFDIVKQSAEEEAGSAKNLVLVPIATIGCGKTTIAHGLTKLFPGWSHVQNDNLTSRKGKPAVFAEACAKMLVNSPVVIADRNNHQKRERQQLFDDLGPRVLDSQFVALHYIHNNEDDTEKFRDRIRQATQERVFARGDNHQTIQAATQDRALILGIMGGFLKRFEPVDINSAPDSEFDLVIDLDPTEDSRQNLEIVVRELHKKYPQFVQEMPSEEKMDEAVKSAFEEYKPGIKHTIGGGGGKKNNPKSKNAQKSKHPDEEVEYFALSVPRQSVMDALKQSFADNASEEKNTGFYKQLVGSSRIQSSFHVTLIHKASSKSKNQLWEKYLSLHRQQKTDTEEQIVAELGKPVVSLEKIVWDDRVMAISVRLGSADANTNTAIGKPMGAEASACGWECVNQVPHITIGTAAPAIKPRESNDMFMGKSEVIQEIPVYGECVLYAEFMAVKPADRGHGAEDREVKSRGAW